MDASLRSAHRKQNRECENPYDRDENRKMLKILSLDKWIQLNRIEQQQQQQSFTNGELVTELTHLKMFFCAANNCCFPFTCIWNVYTVYSGDKSNLNLE